MGVNFSVVLLQWYDIHRNMQQSPGCTRSTMLHSEQKCAYFCCEWRVVGYGAGAFWDL